MNLTKNRITNHKNQLCYEESAFTILSFLFSVIVVYSQSVIDHPKTGLSLNNNSMITKVELTDTTTVMSIHTKYTHGWWIRIPKETYIL